MRISDWSSDVCSSDLALAPRSRGVIALKIENCTVCMLCARSCPDWCIYIEGHKTKAPPRRPGGKERTVSALDRFDIRSEEHTSELQSLMRISYAVFCLKKKKKL